MWDRAGQLGESGEYWMGRMSGLMSDSELQGGSPRLCRLRTASVCALLQQALSCVLTHTGFMGSHKLSSVDDRWVGRHPTVLHGWHWNSVRVTHRLPGEVFAWKTALGYGGPGWTLWYSMQKVATRDTCVVHVCHVVRLFPLQCNYWFESLWYSRIWVSLVRCVQT
jgi:hypothetical protein